MSQLVPNRLLFKFEYPLYRCAKALPMDGQVNKWDGKFILPAFQVIDAEDGFAELYAAWDENGLYIGCQVKGKRSPPRCDPDRFWKSDNIRIMTDMRDTRQIRRATRFCQQFYLLPTGGGRGGKQAVAGSASIHRATADAPMADKGAIPIASSVRKTGYSLTAHLSAQSLNGFDPAENPRIGLLIMVEDLELGQQSLTVGDDLNWWIDPSTWPTAVLTE